MDFDPTDEQSLLIETFNTLYAKWSDPEVVRQSEPLGFDARLWSQLLDFGALEMAETDGASLLDLALVAERHGQWLAPVPMIESQVAIRLLARCGAGAASALLESCVSGDQMVTIALHPADNGTLRLVPGGAIADVALALDGDRLLAVPLASNRTGVDNLGNLPLADVRIPEGVIELKAGASDHFDAARNDWMTLTAAALSGLAAQALEIGVHYAKEREAFGVPIGSFQAIAHPLANSATARDGAVLLSRKAAWSITGQPERFGELAALAFAFAAETARDASYRSLHTHGGYGFMKEYDIQLYFRRAKAWPAVLMEPARAYGLAAERRRRHS